MPLFKTTVSMPVRSATRAAFVPTTLHRGPRSSPPSTPLAPVTRTPDPPLNLEIVGGHERRHPTCDLAHGREERKRAVFFERLVSEAGYFFLQKHVGQFPVRRQVEVGEMASPSRSRSYSCGSGSFTFDD